MRYIWLLMIVVFLVGCNSIDVSSPNGPYCHEQYVEIEKEMADANYCNVDSDCSVIMLGGRYIEFG